MSQIKQFNKIYYDLYPKRLEEIGANPNELIIVRLIPIHPMINYKWTDESEFYEQYYIYIKDYFEYDTIEDAKELIGELFYLFINTMGEELTNANIDEDLAWEYYYIKTIENFYHGLLREKIMLTVSDPYIVYREESESNYIDTKLKIDIELYLNNELYGIQIKSLSYTSVSESIKKQHHYGMSKYIQRYGGTPNYLIFNDEDIPMKLKNGDYLIPYKDILTVKRKDLIVGSIEGLKQYIESLS